MWDQGLESAALLGSDPFILLAPEDQHRDGYLSVERLDFVGVALVGLRDLTVEGGLSVGAEPRLDVWGKCLIADLAVERAPEVCRNDRLVNGRRDLVED